MTEPKQPDGGPMPDSANIARHLPQMAALRPDQPALKIPHGHTTDGRIDYLTLTFRELDAEVDAWGVKLTAAGLRRGDRTLVMVKQGLPLIAAVFALFKLGAVPIVIDPGMGLKNFLRCVARSRPRALLGIPLAQILSRVFFRTFATVHVRIPASASSTARQFVPLKCNPLGYTSHASPSSAVTANKFNKCNLIGYIFPVAEVATNELAAILFTSGSTGAPKGVCYEHGMFEAQVRLIRTTYDIQPGEVDLPMLPIFALFNPALGLTTIVPEIDPRRPAQADPAKIVQAIQQEGVTNSFGSPTLWSKIQHHCRARHLTLPSLKRVLCAGAPVPATLWENPARWLPHSQLHSPYGATEALPVSSVSADEIDPKSVRGACVGRPLSEVAVKIIAITDGPITALAEARELSTGEIGEIIVRGPVVTKCYDSLAGETSAAKIPDGDAVWHRMGDCGYLDAAGLLWFCGRKAERVQTVEGDLFTEPCEQVFRSYPLVVRCALIGLGEPGAQTPALVVQPIADKSIDHHALAHELRRLAVAHEHTRGIARFYFHQNFPVDVRHNAKIHRLRLARWARIGKAYKVSA